jgi:predicted phosphoadenosine phosphosulfate sulfurtransferase
MYQAGVPTRYMRICEPFGPEQRQGLWLYHVIEPERWARCANASAVSAAAEFTPGKITSSMVIANSQTCAFEMAGVCPFLLDSMPEQSAEHYRNKIAVYLRWFEKQG